VHVRACLGIREMPLLPFLSPNVAFVLLPHFQLQGNPEVLVGREPTRKRSRRWKEEHEGDRKQEKQTHVSGLGSWGRDYCQRTSVLAPLSYVDGLSA